MNKKQKQEITNLAENIYFKVTNIMQYGTITNKEFFINKQLQEIKNYAREIKEMVNEKEKSNK